MEIASVGWEEIGRKEEQAMSYFRTCPICGLHLDPGEVCECIKKELPSVVTTEQLKTDSASTELNESTAIVADGEGSCQGQ